ncbi:NADH-quinone oxidoreductase subunit H [Myxococcota bacterium]|nr:NADH-quinone oxidoreductase subunit H [Myxococcota bacterium]MBU1379231.1 NADH-quinone oxidoreductase subunit H [Myxococcota bacterium]MBU1497117.1 NADH-quinone oxidoreductase subunit H [Myxococcota bacterium]
MKLLHWLLPISAFIIAPIIPGIINRVKAFFAGRRGVPILQLYIDIWKLLRKGSTYSHTTSFVFRIAPSVIAAALILCTFFIPWGSISSPVSFSGDLIFIAYLLDVARYFTVIAAMDTGSAFEGMGASREVQFGFLAEPAFLMGILVLVMVTKNTSTSGIMQHLSTSVWADSGILLILVATAWYFLLLTENSRIPVDDPNTHLELTMIHEVMVLDYSGPDFAYILYGSALKLWIFSALIVNILLPVAALPIWLQPIVFIAGTAGVAILVGITESIIARLRLVTVPKIIVSASALCFIALIFRIIG